jgi:hypothetical protein
MKNIKFIIFVIAVILTSSLFAQYPYEFEFLDRNMDYGIVYSTAVSANSTVFAACSFGGLRAYEMQDGQYIQTAYIDNEGRTDCIAFGPNEIIITSNSDHTLTAYEYTAGSFIEIAVSEDTYSCLDFSVNLEGIIYACVEELGLTAYQIVENEIIRLSSFIADDELEKLVLIDDNTVVAYEEGRRTLHVFNFNGMNFELSFIFEEIHQITEIFVYDNNTLFVANNVRDVYSLHYNDNSLEIISLYEHESHIFDIKRGSNGAVFFAGLFNLSYMSYNDNMFELLYNHELSISTSIYDLFIGTDNNIFASCALEGIKTYNLTEGVLTEGESITGFGISSGITQNSENIIFIAHNSYGLDAYEMQNGELILLDNINISAWTKDVAVSSQNILYTANTYNRMQIFEYNAGTLLYHNTIDIDLCPFVMEMDNNENIYLCGYSGKICIYSSEYPENEFLAQIDIDHVFRGFALGTAGYSFAYDDDYNLHAFKYSENIFEHIDTFNLENEIYCISTDNDGKVYISGLNLGLKVFEVIEDQLVLFETLNSNESYRALAIDENHTIFLYNMNGHLEAFEYQSENFDQTASLEVADIAYETMIGNDNNIYLRNSYEGFSAYSYSGYTHAVEENIQFSILNPQLSNHPNPFNPETTISFSLNTGNIEDAEISIYNTKGQKVDSLPVILSRVDGSQYSTIWNAEKFSSGIYFYQLKLDDKILSTQKAVLMK